MHACTLFSCDPISTTCQCHAARSPFRADRLDLRICSYLDEALNEVFRQRRAFGIFFGSEVLEYVCELLPEVQGFLLHFHIVSMFLPIRSFCILSSTYPSYRASILPSFYLPSSSLPSSYLPSSSLAPSSLPSSSLFPPLLFLPLFLSPTAYIHLPSPSLPSSSLPPSPKRTKKTTHLKLLMTIKQQNIHRLQLIHISMPLKFLSNFGSNFRHGHIERIHGLDFRCLLYHTHIAMISTLSCSLFSMSVFLSISSLFLFLLPLSLFCLPPSIKLFQNQKKKSNIPLSTNPDNSTKLSVSHHSMSRLLVAKNIPH